MKKNLLLQTFGLLLLLSTQVNATPLRLDYSVTDLGGGIYDYGFSLVLDNHDGSWETGHGWGWIVFGIGSPTSPLTDFVGNTGDLPIGPYNDYGTSLGSSTGPTLTWVLNLWVPISIGDMLFWSGTSTADLQQGELFFSTFHGANETGGVAVS